jgi:hypothetical protein
MATKKKKLVRNAAKTALAPKKLTRAQKLKREIAKRNRVFEAATTAEKRVLIAKDVIAQIKARRYRPRLGTWAKAVTNDGRRTNPSFVFGEDASIRELFLSKKIVACECCALGAMFMSCTLYNNKMTAEQFAEQLDYEFDVRVATPGGLSNGLNLFFSPAQLKLIEAAFEGNDGAFSVTGCRAEKIAEWSARYENSLERLIAIMENIIKNNGTFKP